ncbi:hypothetical protein E4U26_001878 [Claviceps purpurea]|nr:hypothetical protein E4U26_001878 [Claviceps purpurea]
METPRDIDSDGLSYQSDDDDYDGTFAPDEPEYTHLQYPDEVLEEACHPWGTSQQIPGTSTFEVPTAAVGRAPGRRAPGSRVALWQPVGLSTLI